MSGRFYVLVTGASKGIGKAIALHLDSLGYHVFAGVRKQADGDTLRELASDRLMPLILDVTDAEQIAGAAEQVAAVTGDNGLYGLVNNAGVAASGPLEILSLDSLRWQFEVNVFGQVAVTQALLPLIRKAKGRVIMMSSISGKWSFGFIGAYGASKYALEGVANALRQELHPWGIHVSTILPGVIDTPIWETSTNWVQQQIDTGAFAAEGVALYREALDNAMALNSAGDENGIPPLRVAEKVQQALTAKTPSTRYYVGKDAQVMRVLVNLLPPRWVDVLMRRF